MTALNVGAMHYHRTEAKRRLALLLLGAQTPEALSPDYLAHDPALRNPWDGTPATVGDSMLRFSWPYKKWDKKPIGVPLARLQ